MPSDLVTISRAVQGSLAAAALTGSPTVSYDPFGYLHREDVAGTLVIVSPGGEVRQQARRDWSQAAKQMVVDVDVVAPVDIGDASTIDGLIDLCDEIKQHIQDTSLAQSLAAITHDLLADPDGAEQRQQFETTITFTFENR